MTRVHGGLTYSALRGFRPLLLDLHRPAGDAPAPVVVWVHGGGFQWGDRRYLPETLEPGSLWTALTEAGVAVATVDYRLSGEARFPAQLADLAAALGYLREHAGELGLDAGRIALAGESAGATLAVLAAFADRAAQAAAGGTEAAGGVAAVACWYPITDMTVRHADRDDSPEANLLGGRPVDLPELAALGSPVAQVPADPPPFLLLHGTEDTMVPSTHSERLHEALLKVGGRAQLRLVPGADHIFAGYDDVPALVAQTVRFLADELGS
ncbi:alpha/beta hydrolase [Kitasatospora azatica]|uniref:alpha/beta hydrolase n=1 Tax=Kitasatospora azatica TaxID=58347 RepID=UPI0007C7C9E6|nr:alpha/beta hydrolase [Kitasatospora azatica]